MPQLMRPGGTRLASRHALHIKVSYLSGWAINKNEVNKGHACPDVQYSCVVVGCHLGR